MPKTPGRTCVIVGAVVAQPALAAATTVKATAVRRRARIGGCLRAKDMAAVCGVNA